MKAFLLIVVGCWAAVSGVGSGAGEREGTASVKTEISDQQIVKLPNSVHHSAREDGTHVVTIDGVDAASRMDRERQDPPTTCYQTPMDDIPTIPERVSFTVDHEKRTCTLVPPRELKRSELSAAIDEAAKVRSATPRQGIRMCCQ